MIYLSKEEIEKTVSINDVINYVKTAFSMYEKGMIEAPLRTAIKACKGSLLFMPAYSEKLKMSALKNVNVFPKNAKNGLDTTPAEILLINAENGYALAMLDGTYVTKLRTGAASGSAFDILACKDCRKGALIGTGGQAETQLDAMLAVRNLEEVSIYSRNKEKCFEFTERMRKKHFDKDVNIHMADSSDDCVKDADLIITVTTSSKPVFDGSLVKKGATISCVGTFEPDKHEVDSLLIYKADKIFCDSKSAVLSESGDILIPIKEGLITEKDICGGIGEVINGTVLGRENDDEIIVFETVGIAAQDLVTSAMIYNKYIKGNIMDKNEIDENDLGKVTAGETDLQKYNDKTKNYLDALIYPPSVFREDIINKEPSYKPLCNVAEGNEQFIDTDK